MNEASYEEEEKIEVGRDENEMERKRREEE